MHKKHNIFLYSWSCHITYLRYFKWSYNITAIFSRKKSQFKITIVISSSDIFGSHIPKCNLSNFLFLICIDLCVPICDNCQEDYSIEITCFCIFKLKSLNTILVLICIKLSLDTFISYGYYSWHILSDLKTCLRSLK
jgi:hypothetical protein